MRSIKILALSSMAAAALAWQANAGITLVDGPDYLANNGAGTVLNYVNQTANPDVVALGDATFSGTTVSWTAPANSLVSYIVVKQASQSSTTGSGVYLFAISGADQLGGSFNVNDYIQPNQWNGISFARIYGVGGVPDGGTTAILLGLGLSALGLVRRGRKA